jgi:mitochondrial fission protein ELM1
MQNAWILSDGRAGNERQARALAEAMGTDCLELELALRPPWSWFAPHLERGAWNALPAQIRHAFESQRPAIAIGCGRAAALATALLHARGVFAVQILDPRSELSRWDVVIAPHHDGLEGENVVATIGSLNLITPARLVSAALAHPELAALPTPRTAVLIGGSNRAQALDAVFVDGLLERLASWHQAQGGSFLVSTSRRTPAALIPALRAFCAKYPAKLWTGEADGPNPYLGFLAHASRLVVTPDSVNLLSEACATAKPVFTHTPRPIAGKLARFHAELVQTGRLRALKHAPESWAPNPLRETEAVAAEVLRRFESRRPPR